MAQGTDHVGSMAGLCGTSGELVSHNKQHLFKQCNNFILFGKFPEYLQGIQELPLFLLIYLNKAGMSESACTSDILILAFEVYKNLL
jgi:hypothetical protein